MQALPQLQFKNITREDVLKYFANGWDLTEILFSALKDQEAYTRPPVHGLRHPLIFYYGHPAVLYVNKLRVAGFLKEPVDAYLENILEVGVDEMSWDDMSKNEMVWPSIEEVRTYREKVYNLVKDLILNDPRLDPKTSTFLPDTPAWALVMGFEHERIHLETSSVLMRELPLKYLHKPDGWPESFESSATANGSSTAKLLKISAASVKMGKPSAFPSFGWDNEYGQRNLSVDEFEVSNALITNQEFLQFVNEGGYREERFWSKEGWQWRGFRNTKHPTFWVPEGPGGLHQYKLRTIFEVVNFQPDWPAIVNFHEAKAYCHWLTEKTDSALPFRLISEAEHHRLRAVAGTSNSTGWNLNLRFGTEISAFHFSANGVFDLFGNAWQWCEDEFNPLEGFNAHPYYEDFSTPCFDGRHQMIMGGSFVSTGDEAEPYARFHFRPHFFQHAGFRVARSTKPDAKDSAVRLSRKAQSHYESEELLSQYLMLHFSAGDENIKLAPELKHALRFPQRCAEKVIEFAIKKNIPMTSALDIGCAVGGSSFALSTDFEKVVGIDLSSSFIRNAQTMQKQGRMTFRRKDQGDLYTSMEALRPASSKVERIEFREGDAGNLDPDLKNFDAILMANLLCRLPDPKAALLRLVENSVLAPGGLLVLVSPYSWLEQYTQFAAWLGGKEIQGQKLTSDQDIRNLLSTQFEFVAEENMPLVIREHERKYQYIVSHLMVWQRKF